MTKPIGPTFPDELKVAGLLGLPFSWGSDGVFQFDPRMSKVQQDAVLAVYSAHDPSRSLADPDAFEQDILMQFPDPAQRNALLRLYPLFLWALRGRDWPAVRAMLVDAKTTLAITPNQYDAVKVSAATRALPIVLP